VRLSSCLNRFSGFKLKLAFEKEFRESPNTSTSIPWNSTNKERQPVQQSHKSSSLQILNISTTFLNLQLVFPTLHLPPALPSIFQQLPQQKSFRSRKDICFSSMLITLVIKNQICLLFLVQHLISDTQFLLLYKSSEN
jgi:hypothetical protein